MDKILRINMSAPGGPAVKTDALGAYAGLGGRAMTSTVVAKEVPPTCHPLGAANKLVIAPGLLSGSAAAMSGRLSVGCKSPLTGGIKEANSGGQAAQVMARLGYAAIVLEGQAKDDTFYKVFINKDGVKVESAADLKGLGNYATVEKLVAQYGKKAACISIGQAGEMKMSAASIAVTDMEQRPTRHAGRGGVGAVMGSKGIKVIVLDDEGLKMRTPAEPEKFKAANKAFVEGLRKHPVTGEGLPAYGTNVLTNVVNEAGGYPTNNFQTGQFAGASNISGETQAALENERGGEGSATHGCHRGCVIRCSGTFYGQGRQLPHQAARIRNRLGPRRQLRHRRPGCHRPAGPHGRRLRPGHHRDGRHHRGGHGGRAGQVRRRPGGHPAGQGSRRGTPLGRILGNGADVTGQCFGVERVPTGQKPGHARLRPPRRHRASA